MKFGVVCDVEGKTYLENGTTFEIEGLSYIFYINDEGLLKQIRIISKVDESDKYFYFKSPIEEDGKFTVRYGFEEHIKNNLISELQRLESALALVGSMKRVYWNKPTFEYYPETEEEHSRFNILPTWFYLHEVTTDDPKIINNNLLFHIVQEKELFKPLVVPMAFYREAKTEYAAARYINAFFNSYFIIEGLFGNGKWKTSAITEELNKSQVFTSFVKKILDDVAENNDEFEGLTKQQLEDELNTRNQPYTVEGLINLIIKKRGELHHFSIASTKSQGTPLNNADYKIISFITWGIATDALAYYLTKTKT